MIRLDVVLEDGTVLTSPDPPESGASIDDVIAYLRADCAYRDAIASAGSGAFDMAFRNAVRSP